MQGASSTPRDSMGAADAGMTMPDGPAPLWPRESALPAALLDAEPSLCALARFCPRGFRRRLVAHGPHSLVSLLAFEPGQREEIHQHRDSSEYFHGVSGRGQVFIADRWLPIDAGRTYFRPAGAWHGVHAEARLLLLSVQAPVPSRAQTVWQEPPERATLRPEDREALAHYRCCRCPCCGGHLRRARPAPPCGNCGAQRAAARCENCGWRTRALCLPVEFPRAG